MTRTLSALLLALVLVLAACGAADDQGERTCTTKADCNAGEECIQNKCFQPADVQPGEVDASPGEGVTDVAVDVPDDGKTDVPDSPDQIEDSKTDVPIVPDIPVEADNDPPTVASTTPAADQDNVDIPFTITVVFNEPMKTTTIYEQSFEVKDIKGTQVAGTLAFSANDTTAVFTPTVGVLAASPYTVTLKGSIIQDAAGNKLGEWQTFTFYTRPPKDLSKYDALAAKYAPVINQATDLAAPHYDYLTAFDVDGDWDGLDTLQYVQQTATELPANVYYAVTETSSHYFVQYVFFYPFRNTAEPTERFGNDVSGALVVVRKYPTEAPVAVETYYKRQSDEPSNAFVTSESGIVPDGTSPESLRINGVYPQAELFPGDRYVAYLTAGSHQSCVWNWTGGGTIINYCKLSAAMKNEIESHRIQYVYKGVAEAIAKGAGWPVAKEDVGYGLQDLVVKLWPRRKAEGVVGDSEITYTPEQGRPGANQKMGRSLVTSLDGDFSFAPWAWRWWQSGVAGYDLPRGMLFLDPAWFVATRHNLYTEFDPQTKAGFSTDYCFNAFFNIDNRSKPECQ